MAETDRLLLTVTEAAEAVGIGRSTLYLLLASGAIPSVRIRGKRLIRVTDLHAFVGDLPAQYLDEDEAGDQRVMRRAL